MKLFFLIFFFSFVHCTHLNRNLQSQKDLKKNDWHLHITKANQAWSLSQGSEDIIVAIIDTGIDTRHPDLKENLWKNKKELHGKPGIDDDQNGYIDDIHGWNFTNNSNDIWDHHGHGTHVAGLIGGKGKVCEPGIASKVRLMTLKYYDTHSTGSQNLQNTIKSIRYAINNGAHIINFSGGGYEPSKDEKAVIAEALLKDILFVSAAGNDNTNIENKPYYPASYNLPNIFSVGSTDDRDRHSSFSNRGSNVKIHAPGGGNSKGISSTLPPSRCGYLTGTSQSTPIATGGAVLIKASQPEIEAVEIVNYLKKTSDKKDHLKDKSETGGRVNLYRAVGSQHFNVTINENKIEYSEHQKIGKRNPEEDSPSRPQDPLSLLIPKEFIKTKEEDPKTARNPVSLIRRPYFKKIEIQYSDPQ